MILESVAGRLTIVADKFDPNRLVISADNPETLISLLDGVELIGGEETDNQTFSAKDIHSVPIFGRPRFQVSLTRAQFLRYLQYEIFNFLTYPSLTKMTALSSRA